MIGDLLMIVLICFGVFFSSRLRKADDLRLAQLFNERRRLAMEIGKINRDIVELNVKIAKAKQRREAADRECERREREIAENEHSYKATETLEPMRIHVFDRTQIRPENLWVVSFIRERVTDNDSSRTSGWGEARHFILSSLTGREAEDRCRLRYPGATGYRLMPARSHVDVIREHRA